MNRQSQNSFSFHIPVMVEQVCCSLKINQAHSAIDATLGDGSYSLNFLQRMPNDGRVVGLDLDPDAIERAGRRLTAFGERFQAVRENFRNVDLVAHQFGFDRVDAVAADLGVSTLQLSDPQKGFTFSKSGPLSMRMDSGNELTAAQVVNTYSEDKLRQIFFEYGEERASRRIARAIVLARKKRNIETTADLADIVRGVVRQHTVKSLARIFQAIRIFLNDELQNLRVFLDKSFEVLRPEGRLAVVSYHSLEDRIVKRFFQNGADPCICSREIPVCVCGKKPILKIIDRGSTPSEEELERNRKSRSSRLRVAEKL
ncbi:16S rRNA (cytosine(1402)-N(4))-methyltransferase RsmH [candidate division KSB1 bacterium]|nr:16S rRNA (cytosine(1402)-N(4))-methyltransferase RsmH [candidate division KSB1 bacterium]